MVHLRLLPVHEADAASSTPRGDRRRFHGRLGFAQRADASAASCAAPLSPLSCDSSCPTESSHAVSLRGGRILSDFDSNKGAAAHAFTPSHKASHLTEQAVKEHRLVRSSSDPLRLASSFSAFAKGQLVAEAECNNDTTDDELSEPLETYTLRGEAEAGLQDDAEGEDDLLALGESDCPVDLAGDVPACHLVAACAAAMCLGRDALRSGVAADAAVSLAAAYACAAAAGVRAPAQNGSFLSTLLPWYHQAGKPALPAAEPCAAQLACAGAALVAVAAAAGSQEAEGAVQVQGYLASFLWRSPVNTPRHAAQKAPATEADRATYFSGLWGGRSDDDLEGSRAEVVSAVSSSDLSSMHMGGFKSAVSLDALQVEDPPAATKVHVATDARRDSWMSLESLLSIPSALWRHIPQGQRPAVQAAPQQWECDSELSADILATLLPHVPRADLQRAAPAARSPGACFDAARLRLARLRDTRNPINRAVGHGGSTLHQPVFTRLVATLYEARCCIEGEQVWAWNAAVLLFKRGASLVTQKETLVTQEAERRRALHTTGLRCTEALHQKCRQHLALFALGCEERAARSELRSFILRSIRSLPVPQPITHLRERTYLGAAECAARRGVERDFAASLGALVGLDVQAKRQLALRMRAEVCEVERALDRQAARSAARGHEAQLAVGRVQHSLEEAHAEQGKWAAVLEECRKAASEQALRFEREQESQECMILARCEAEATREAHASVFDYRYAAHLRTLSKDLLQQEIADAEEKHAEAVSRIECLDSEQAAAVAAVASVVQRCDVAIAELTAERDALQERLDSFIAANPGIKAIESDAAMNLTTLTDALRARHVACEELEATWRREQAKLSVLTAQFSSQREAAAEDSDDGDEVRHVEQQAASHERLLEQKEAQWSARLRDAVSEIVRLEQQLEHIGQSHIVASLRAEGRKRRSAAPSTEAARIFTRALRACQATTENACTTAPLPGATRWVPDSMSTSCSRCLVEFGLVARRHHCRRCGNIVCAKCSPFKEVVPTVCDTPVRVCTPCYEGADL